MLSFFVPGEVERLLREYTQNQEMVRNIGSHYYQIIYPVQLRQHKKMGISTREIGSSKVRKERSSVCHAHFISFYMLIFCTSSHDSNQKNPKLFYFFVPYPTTTIRLEPRAFSLRYFINVPF